MKFFRRNIFTILLVLALIFVLGFSAVTYLKQEQLLTQKQLELDAKVKEHEDLMAALRILQEQVDQLDNAETKESLARQKLNMIMPDEMIYVITFDRLLKDDE